MFDTQSYYHAIQGDLNSLFPWKSVWKQKIPKQVASFCGLLLMIESSLWII